MTETRLEHFLKSVGYPERISDGSTSFTMRVDGMEVVAEESSGRIRLVFRLTDDKALLPTLASYAVGRMLHEDAVLTHHNNQAFLWQDAPADADDRTYVRLFETFADSCEWWRARLAERAAGDVEEIENSEAVIRP